MKRIVLALAVAALVNGTQALAEDAPIALAGSPTYADQHAGDPEMGSSAAAFPGEAREDPIVLPSRWTYADGYSDESGKVAENTFPGSAREDPIVVESMATYADSFAGERNMQASGSADPALAE